jgi:hypothetical protein
MEGEGVEERREGKGEEEKDIPEHGGEEKELRREEKKKKKNKEKGDGSVVKLGILGFLFGCLLMVLPTDN